MLETAAAAPAAATPSLSVAEAAALPVDEVFTRLSATPEGLTEAEAAGRLRRVGHNAVRVHKARASAVLARQLRSPLLVLLAATATASFFVGERTDAVIIGVILVLSIGLGFLNEFRAERAAEALHAQIRHTCTVFRDGRARSLDVTDLVPGDVVEVHAGEVVPADLRLFADTGLETDEALLTGESLPVAKGCDPVAPGAPLAELTGAALMGTIVHRGTGNGVVVATGSRAQFGSIALALGERHGDTEFQRGLRDFSVLLVRVAAILSVTVFVINLVLHRPTIDALLFALAIAVGITPQLLPAVVSTSLAAGTHRLSREQVLVKRLVCIEDLGNVQVLCTDKTGTLTQGRISFMRAVGPDGAGAADPLVLGLVCNDAAPGAAAQSSDPLDSALWASPAAAAHLATAASFRRLAALPFDPDRRLVTVVVEAADGRRLLVTKGAPEAVLQACADVPGGAQEVLDAEFGAGSRVVAVASREWDGPGGATLSADDERRLRLVGFLVFLDAPKTSARRALRRLSALGIDVKVITGDNALVAARVCADLGVRVGGTLTGADLDGMTDEALHEAVATTTVFARVGPGHKARIVSALRHGGLDVAFLGDGVNDAVALHAADVGIAVDSGADVAKDAADIILLEKDLDVLASGVVAGRRIFANTIKYVLMGTSSNFGNMFSAAGASALLSFLPMLPSQVLLNNLLYDASQLAIPTDEVDAEQLARPAHWNIGQIRRYMLFFGPISSLFDFATFAVMLWAFDAHATLFRSGWFIESLATQTLVIFVIRTRRPFVRSRPSVTLLAAAVLVVVVGAVLPFAPLAHDLGFAAPSGGFLASIAAMVVGYLLLVEVAKQWFFRAPVRPPVPRVDLRTRRLHRRAARFSTTHDLSRAPRRPRRPRERRA